jgi:hypothetical protein
MDKEELDFDDFVLTEEEIDEYIRVITELEDIQYIEERVVDLAQRRKMARTMKRLAPRLKRKKEISQKKMADKGKLSKRSAKAATSLLRKKYAGKNGGNYAGLSPAQKMTVDRMIEKKRGMVGKLAKRMLPKVRKAEQERLKNYRTKQNEEVNIDESQLVIRNESALKNVLNTLVKDFIEKGSVDRLIELGKYLGKKVSRNGKLITFEGIEYEANNEFNIYEAIDEAMGAYVDDGVTQGELKDLEKFGDRLLNKFGVDIEFTRHFADRMNDSRNKPSVKVSELKKLFLSIASRQAKGIKSNVNSEVVLKQMQSDLNIPVVIKYNRNKDEIEVVHKTIMRKKNFGTSDKVLQY